MLGRQVPCSDPALGWFSAADSCYYKALPGAPPPGVPVAPTTHSGSGAFYVKTCGLSGVRFTGVGVNQQVVWLASPPARGGGSALPSPAVLAQSAVRRLGLPGPQIRTSPPADSQQLIFLPTWMWVSGGWSSQSATAAVPGESVTATARPSKVVWSTGDGAQVTCDGPGTPYTPGADPHAASPDCGHIYTQPSSTVPGGRYTLAATVFWQVNWSGGGASGALNVQRSASVPLLVVEAEAINR
jgi:hypothetical protein